MNISQNGINSIKKFEGCRLKAYKPVPTEKFWTIGWGHYGEDVKEGQTITQKQADDLFLKDIQSYINGVNSLVKIPINQNQADALYSFVYNCGVDALRKSTMLILINKKDFTNAANEFARYCHSGTTVLPGLVRRREAEKQLFLKPVVSNSTQTPSLPVWKGTPLKKGQIGRLTILKPINLWTRNGEKLEEVRVLKPQEYYPVYGRDNLHGGQYNLGANHWVTDMNGYIQYETPSKALLDQAKEYYKDK